MITSSDVTDPKYRRLRKALAKAEDNLSKAIEQEQKHQLKELARRWNGMVAKVERIYLQSAQE